MVAECMVEECRLVERLLEEWPMEECRLEECRLVEWPMEECRLVGMPGASSLLSFVGPVPEEG
jgi:hypothetical protein